MVQEKRVSLLVQFCSLDQLTDAARTGKNTSFVVFSLSNMHATMLYSVVLLGTR